MKPDDIDEAADVRLRWAQIESERRRDWVGSALCGALLAAVLVLWIVFSEGPW